MHALHRIAVPYFWIRTCLSLVEKISKIFLEEECSKIRRKIKNVLSRTFKCFFLLSVRYPHTAHMQHCKGDRDYPCSELCFFLVVSTLLLMNKLIFYLV